MQEWVTFPTKLGIEETAREKAIVLVEYMNITGSESADGSESKQIEKNKSEQKLKKIILHENVVVSNSIASPYVLIPSLIYPLLFQPL